jgi:hypothetical protein
MPSHDGPKKRTIPSLSRTLPFRCAVLSILVLFGGCGVAPDRNLRAFNICLTRHPQDAPLCEGPRQAYEVDLPTVAASQVPGLHQ